jgi:hypothetical protein
MSNSHFPEPYRVAVQVLVEIPMMDSYGCSSITRTPSGQCAISSAAITGVRRPEPTPRQRVREERILRENQVLEGEEQGKKKPKSL